MFVEDNVYRRRDIHQLYGGQEQGGISTPAKHKFIMLFVGESGEQYGYSDGWHDHETYYYTGEGRLGDMVFQRGNRAIRDHLQNGKTLHLFEYVRSGHVRYIGQMQYLGHHHAKSRDVSGNLRQAIVFELTPVKNKT